MNYWLMKSEPKEFNIDDLAAKTTEAWDGVRNYQARNMMRDQMQLGDKAFFYHSNCEVPGIVGIMQIVKTGYPDPTAFDPRDKHYDPKSHPEQPRWFLVEVSFVEKFPHTIALAELKQQAALSDMSLLRKGNRLSVMPVTGAQWDYIIGMLSSNR